MLDSLDKSLVASVKYSLSDYHLWQIRAQSKIRALLSLRDFRDFLELLQTTIGKGRESLLSQGMNDLINLHIIKTTLVP